MKAIYANYLIPYVTGIAAFFILWVGAVFVFDGFIPFLCMLLFGAWFLLGIPYLLYSDYRNVKKYMSGNPSIPNVVGEIVKKFGIPEALANAVVKNVEAKLTKQPTKLEKHG
jgi:hypothetical protein